jgi:hypothetical protein
MKFLVSRYALLALSFLIVCLTMAPASQAQTPDAVITGVVEDSSGAVIPDATITIVSKDQGFRRVVKTNNDGLFNAPALISGRYQVTVQAKGFQTTVLDGLKLDVAATANYEFKLKVGSQDQTITVSAGGPTINTADASVSTVIDQQLISELPLNGRSLDTLFLLTPGVVPSGTQNAGGQYSVNGQRSSGNTLTVDGVSGDMYLGNSTSGGPFGTAQTGFSGSTYATSASGGTNGLLPVDAVEEYRIQTSTYSAEYGRSPGGQIQIRTRGGTNNFHGSAFEYFRNQVMDATDWFVKYDGLKQAALRMNDFGGTLGGPIIKNKLFFFVAHETLYLDQPNNISTEVPSAYAKQQVSSTFAPFLAAYPTGNGGTATTAQYPQYTDIYNAEYATQILDHSTSARFDAELPHDYKGFFRFNLAPSHSQTTDWLGSSGPINLDTYTAGITKRLRPNTVNETTFNYSSNSARFANTVRAIDGAQPSALNQYCQSQMLSYPTNCIFVGLRGWGEPASGSFVGANAAQINLVNTLRWSIGHHNLSLGVDYRRLSTKINPYAVEFTIAGELKGPSGLASSTLDAAELQATVSSSIAMPVSNISAFSQDDWKVTNKLTVNYGLRWELNPAISQGLPIVGNINDLSTLVPGQLNTILYPTTYLNFAPRLGAAYLLSSSSRFGSVLRAGVGVFYDTGQAATTAGSVANGYPYLVSTLQRNVPFSGLSFPEVEATLPLPTLPTTALYVVAPNLKLPYTTEWNVAVEQQLFGNTTLSATYVGAAGDNLASTIMAYGLAPALVSSTGYMKVLTNRGLSNYQALQMQATIRTRSGIDGIVAYTYSHNIDNGSSDFTGPLINVTDYRGNADDDIRQMFSVGLSLKARGISRTRVASLITNGWVLNTFTRLQTASPLSVTSQATIGATINDFQGFADRVSGVPVYLHSAIGANGKRIPGGVQLNPAAFVNPPEDSNGDLLRDGDSGRNAYRMFGVHEFDLSAGRRFSITERVGLEFKAEAFNILNTPTFADVGSLVGEANFGQAQNTYAGYNGGNGGLNSTFQLGGARNIQLTGRITF